MSNLLVLSAEVTGAFGADADNQARERLVLAFVLIAFPFGVSCLLTHLISCRLEKKATHSSTVKRQGRQITDQRKQMLREGHTCFFLFSFFLKLFFTIQSIRILREFEFE